MNRPGTLLIPMLAGFLITVAVVSWRSPWWHRDPALTPTRIEVRPAHLRIVQVHLTAGLHASFTATPTAPASAPPEAQLQRAAQPPAPPTVPRERARRRFARGARTNE